MTKLLALTVSLAFATLFSGCMFAKKERKPKESSSIASEVEETFRRRWLDKRAAELAAQGSAPDAARGQAEAEFRDRFVFADRAKK